MATILFYQNLTDNELANLPKERALPLLPISLSEAHGPHLPLGTDFLIAEKFTLLLAQHLAENNNSAIFLLLPVVPLGVGGIQRPGTLNHEQTLVKNVLYQFGERLVDHGFKQGIMISGHAGKGHLQAMSAAARRLKKQRNFEFLPLTSYLFMDTGLQKMGHLLKQQGDPLPPYDGHAGLWETSVMLHLYPKQVNPIYRTLPPSEDVEQNGYRGNPAGATAQIGERLVTFLLNIARLIAEKHFPFLANGS